MIKVIAANAVKEHPLKETRKWFKETFPNYEAVPRFDADGYLIVDIQETESVKGSDDE